MNETGVIYFRLNKEQHGYDGDETKNCSLTGVEIDKNFHFLRGNDIASGAWHSEDGGYIKFTRVNGTDFTVSGINASQDISLEGSEFITESGGTLSLVINNGEPYYITGMTEIFEDFIDSLSGLTCQCPDDSSITADIIALGEELDDQRVDFERKIKKIEDRIDKLIENYEAFKSKTCEKFETEKNERIREDKKLYGLITAETKTRENETVNLQRSIEGRTNYLQTKIEQAKDYVNNLYIDDPSNPEDCDGIKWGVIIKTDNETRKKRIILNLNPYDEFLSQNCNYLSSTISLRYNSDNNRIELIGKNGTAVSHVDAKDFIQKGFLKDARVENRVIDPELGEEPCLILEWDTGGTSPKETLIRAKDLFTQYISGNGIDIDSGYTISVVLGSEFLAFDNNKRLITNDFKIEAKIRELASEVLDNAINDPTSNLNTRIARQLDGKLDKSDFSEYTATTDTVISDIQDAVEDLSELEGRVSSTEASIGQINAKIEELEEKIDHGGGGITIDNIVSKDGSISITEEQDNVLNITVSKILNPEIEIPIS